MKRTPGSRLVLVSGLEARQLGLSRRHWRGRPLVNFDCVLVDRRRLERARRRLAEQGLAR